MKSPALAPTGFDPTAAPLGLDVDATTARSTAGDWAQLTANDVFQTHGDFVWASLQRLGVRPSDLDDAFQEVFIVVHTRLSSFEGRSRLSTWLFGICIRVCAAQRRRAHVRRENPSGLAIDEVSTGDESPERVTERRQESDSLAAMLDEMEITRRAVFVMYEIDEIPCEEIASILSVPIGTVYSRLVAARKELAAIHARHSARARHKERIR